MDPSDYLRKTSANIFINGFFKKGCMPDIPQKTYRNQK